MDQSNLSSVFDTCFWICLSFTILFLVISLILFFLFDIRTIFSIRTGRAKAKTIKEMELANSQTGRLRVKGKTNTSKLGKTESKPRRAAVITPPQSNTQVNTHTAENVDKNYTSNYGNEATEVLDQGSGDTELLDQGSEETSLLSQNSGKGNIPVQSNINDESGTPTTDLSELNTSVLSGQSNINQSSSSQVKDIGFTIIKKVMLIHTEETIQ